MIHQETRKSYETRGGLVGCLFAFLIRWFLMFLFNLSSNSTSTSIFRSVSPSDISAGY